MVRARGLRPPGGWWLTALLVLSAAGPACLRRPAVLPDQPVETTRHLLLYDHPLEIHFVRPGEPAGRPLLLFATGDGGWRGKDLQAFREMVGWGFPLAGFSAPDYLRHIGYVSQTTTPAKLARDYARLIDFAKRELQLPGDTRTVLVGVSRGAGLAVVAAGQRELQPALGGVLAIALTREEEYVRHYRTTRAARQAGQPTRELVEIETYEYLPRLGGLPLALVQSTRDNYLPADEARRLFGPDGEHRQLRAVEARDHSFSDARAELYRQMRASLDWLCQRLSPAPATEANGE